MSFRIKASTAGLADFVGAATNFLFPGAPAAVSVASFSPIQAPVGTSITLFGTGFLNGQTVRFNGPGGTVAVVSAVVSSNVATATVPAGAASGPISVTNGTGTGTSSANFTVGALLASDSYAVLPNRLPRWYNTPPSRTGVPAGRITRLTTSSTWADLSAAITAQSANLNAGTAFVLIPNGSNIVPPVGSGSIPGPVFASAPAFPLVIAQTEWFDGGVVYSTGASLTKAQANAQPVIRPCRLTNAVAYECDPWIRWTSKADLVMIGIRSHDDVQGEGYTRGSISIGDTSSAATVGNNIGHFAAWWCSSGLQQDGAGKPFTAAGLWRYGMGRPYELNGSGAVLRNCYHYGHGAPGAFGADRGWFSGWTSAGPWYMKGNTVENPGGIAFFHGGAYQYAGVNCEDVTIEQNYMYRTDPWNKADPTNRWLDANGVACPYDAKNIGEIKSGYRWLVQDNVFANDYSYGQTEAQVWKANFQDSSGRSVGSNDFTYRRNILTTRNKGGMTLSLAAGLSAELLGPGEGTDAFQRISIHDNIISCRLGMPSTDTSNTTRARLLLHSRAAAFGAGTTQVTRQPEQIDISNNLFFGFSTGGPDFIGYIWDGAGSYAPVSQYRLKHNIFGASLMPGGANGITYLWRFESLDGTRTDTIRDLLRADVFPSVDVGTNAFIAVPVGNTTGAVVQHEYTTPAAAGLNVIAVDQYSYAGGAALLTAGAGGVPIGPDLAALAAMRTAVLAGVVS